MELYSKPFSFGPCSCVSLKTVCALFCPWPPCGDDVCDDPCGDLLSIFFHGRHDDPAHEIHRKYYLK